MRYNAEFDPKTMNEVKKINEKIENSSDNNEILKLLQQRQNKALELMSFPIFRNYRSYFPW